MKVLLIADESVNEYISKTDEIKIEMENKKITALKRKAKNTFYDVIVIFSDNLEYIAKHIDMKNSKTIYVIMTQNLTSEYIMNCIKLTPYVGFSKNTNEYIIQKILNIYQKSQVISNE